MDFDGGQKKGFENKSYRETQMKELKNIAAVFGPGIALCLLLAVNTMKLDNAKRLPAQDSSWMSSVKKGISLSLSER